jgi:hypothetical protein
MSCLTFTRQENAADKIVSQEYTFKLFAFLHVKNSSAKNLVNLLIMLSGVF